MGRADEACCPVCATDVCFVLSAGERTPHIPPGRSIHFNDVAGRNGESGEMPNLRTFRACVIAGAIAGLSSGCQQSATAPHNPRVSQTDLDFITGVTNLAEFDRRAIQGAMDFNPDPRVKSLAFDLQSRIEGFQARVQPIAVKDGIQPPANMTLFEQSDMHSRVATLLATSKYDFDGEFLDEEVFGNQEVLRQAEHVVAGPPGDPELHVLAVEAVGRLKDNIRRLQALRAEMKRP